jgi:hypothetical protein
MNQINAVRVFAIAVTAAALLSTPAHSQSLGQQQLEQGKGKGGRSPYPTENRPKVDEKAYKAALDRIPEPKKKYDPWEIARPGEPTADGEKPN